MFQNHPLFFIHANLQTKENRYLSNPHYFYQFQSARYTLPELSKDSAFRRRPPESRVSWQTIGCHQAQD